jgi:3-deoxy-D-manno-octulosonate 8-phosphate phosphatase (KDO 8-P phosphatase)
MDHIETIFTELGAVFCNSASDVSTRLKGIKAFVFDWDGVFNNAAKNADKSSNFNEADSMGTNMLRFSYYLIHQQTPKMAIISGERNEMAFYFSGREHFHASYYKIPDKMIALNHFCQKHGLKHSEVAYFFDDVLDLSVASVAGLRIMIIRKANPLLKNYVLNNALADYITAHESGNFAIREVCEMLMGLTGNYTICLDERKDFSAIYKEYLEQRQSVQTEYFTLQDYQIVEGS